jgi:hypothetical protein
LLQDYFPVIISMKSQAISVYLPQPDEWRRTRPAPTCKSQSDFEVPH